MSINLPPPPHILEGSLFLQDIALHNPIHVSLNEGLLLSLGLALTGVFEGLEPHSQGIYWMALV